MATLNQLQDSPGDNPIQVTQVNNTNTQVEPLGGPLTIDQLMDRFPDTVYDQGTDTHLYRFMTALCGDAGAGILKKQSYFARLITEGQHLTFTDLDTFYTQHFRFERLKSELYPFDPTTGSPLDPSNILTAAQWNEIEANDNAYQQRMADYMHATRVGSSPEGIKLAARGATGIDVEVIENYKAIFDSYSDDILGYTLQGATNSVNEFILTPRVVDGNGNADAAISYQANLERDYNPTANTITWGTSTQTYLNPDVEHNMVELVDRIRPAGSVMSIQTTNIHYKPIHVHSVMSSSSRFRLIRYVTGQPDVNWPDIDPSQGYFIEAGDEAEVTYQPSTIIDLPNIYQTIESIHAYENYARGIFAYATGAFYTGNPSPYSQYVSQHYGAYYSVISSIFTFLKLAPKNFLFDAEHALADNNTVATLIGRSNTNGN